MQDGSACGDIMDDKTEADPTIEEIIAVKVDLQRQNWEEKTKRKIPQTAIDHLKHTLTWDADATLTCKRIGQEWHWYTLSPKMFGINKKTVGG